MRGIVSGRWARAATALAVVSATFLATASGAGAATINYVFEPGSSITATEANPPNASYTETITGSFTFNTSTDALSAVNVTLSGSPSYFSPNPIIFVDPFAPFNAGTTNFGFANASTLLLALEFQGWVGPAARSPAAHFTMGKGIITHLQGQCLVASKLPPPHSPPLSRSSPLVSVRWVCLVGAGSGRLLPSQPPSQNT